MIRSSRFGTLVLAGVVGSVLAGCGSKEAASPPVAATAATDSGIVLPEAQRAQIQTVAVASTSFNPAITTTGTVAFNGDRSTPVLAAISGPVVKILVNTGDSVTAGQVLATVSSPDFAAAISGYRKSEAAFHNAQRIETLDEKLFAADALARSDLDQAKSDLSAAEADRDAAIQQLRSLGVDDASIEAVRDGKPAPGAQSAIRSPIAGVVVEKLINQGQLLQAGTTQAFTIADLSTVWVMGNAFESMIGAVHKGETVTVTTDASPGFVPGARGLCERGGRSGQQGDGGTHPRAESWRRPQAEHARPRGHPWRAAEERHPDLPSRACCVDDENLPYVFIANGKDRFLRRQITLGGRSWGISMK